MLKTLLKIILKIYIPNAIKVAYKLKDPNTPFIWTVGAWMIDRALKYDDNGIVEIYNEVQRKYPEAYVHAATLDDVMKYITWICRS